MPQPTLPHQFKGFADWIEVFRAGDHVDSKGRAVSFSEADLDQMVANVALAPAPAVIGHPKHNDPAYGWAREAKRKGASLFAKFADINPDFERGVESGAYRNRSVSVFKDPAAGWRVQHVGWLGAAPPAITGLQPLDFAAPPAGAEVHDFTDVSGDYSYAIDDIASLLRGLREHVIARDGLEAADATLPGWRIESIAATASRIRQATVPASFQQPQPPTGVITMAFTQADIDRATEAAAAKAKTEATAEFAAKDQELVRLRAERQAERIGVQIAGWKAKGLVTPAEEPGLAQFMSQLEAHPENFQFSAADGKSAERQPAVWFAEFMASRKPVVKLGARTDDPLPQPTDMQSVDGIVAAATAWRFAQKQAGVTVSIDEAVQHVRDTQTAGA